MSTIVENEFNSDDELEAIEQDKQYTQSIKQEIAKDDKQYKFVCQFVDKQDHGEIPPDLTILDFVQSMK